MMTSNQPNQRPRRRAEAGFTLVELMVVVAIIAILATIVGVNVIGQMDEASVAQAQAQIKNFKTALMAYRIKFNRFPNSSEGLDALVKNEKGVNFLESNTIPKDPWGNDYVYKTDDKGGYTILCHGQDGQPGGSGPAADISSDNLSGKED